jgi:L-seryl-tRNA(Ser) seleniumtransferase
MAAIRELVPLLTGAEAGFAVNNNAAALFLAIAALAAGREVLVSRGQLVEIGGSFRLPEILEAAGAKLREVGTTNRTKINDFGRARSEATALVLRVHRSNFKLVGFTEEPSIEELAAFSRKEGLVLVDDLGSGALRRYADLFPDEPCIEDSIEGGADLITVSGDKLLGVTQAGIIAGKSGVVERLMKHPIARIVRLDKTLIAGLEAGLRIHLRGSEEARRWIPLLRFLSRDEAEVAAAADRGVTFLRARLGEGWNVATARVKGEIGGGSLPGVTVESHAITLVSTGCGADEVASRLRAGAPPVLGRIQDERTILDMRAIDPEDEGAFLDAVARALVGER